jgi:cyclin A
VAQVKTRQGAKAAEPIQLQEEESQQEEEDAEEEDAEEDDEASMQNADEVEEAEEADAEMADEDDEVIEKEAEEDQSAAPAQAAAAAVAKQQEVAETTAPASTSTSAVAAAAAPATAPTTQAPASSSSSHTLIPLSPSEQASWQQCLSDPCQEYSDSIYQHLRATELLHFPDPLYMDTVQGDLTHAMRSILCDWLCEVAEEYKLSSQTLFLSVSYIDRFLSRVPIDRTKLQLVGVTAMLLASKYWEIYPPAIDEFVYISDNTYRKEEVLQMENALLTALKFQLTTPTSWEFSRRFCRAANADKQTEMLVDYFLELFLQESSSLRFRPSLCAASAVFLSRYTLGLSPWTQRLEVQSGVRVEEMQRCVREMHSIYVKTCAGQNQLKAVRQKYAEEKRMRVADIKPRNMS